jgi:integrase
VSAPSFRTPSYRLHKPTGQAVVTLAGRDIYLGRHRSVESLAEYDRLLAEWLASGRRLPVSVGGSDGTVNELMLAYIRHAEGYYRKDGKPTSEVRNIGLAIRPVRQLYGHTMASRFGPLALKAVRETLIESGICRNEVNKRVRHIVRAFKWAVGEEMIPAAVHQGLQSVVGLRRGRSEARETDPVKPVPEAFVEAVHPHVSRQVWAMVEVQRLSGMRPGEVCLMRACDIDTSGRIWVYTPESHKTEHHGKERRVYLGPQAQAILRPWLRPVITAYLFSPAEASVERKAELRRNRKTPVQPSQRDRSKLRPERSPGERYDTDSYRRAIARGCNLAGVPGWHPHQLRHNAATRLRKEFGLDTTRAVLGHSSTAVTEIYAELDREKAAEAMARVG